jgi:hypothetical protein
MKNDGPFCTTCGHEAKERCWRPYCPKEESVGNKATIPFACTGLSKLHFNFTQRTIKFVFIDDQPDMTYELEKHLYEEIAAKVGQRNISMFEDNFRRRKANESYWFRVHFKNSELAYIKMYDLFSSYQDYLTNLRWNQLLQQQNQQQ